MGLKRSIAFPYDVIEKHDIDGSEKVIWKCNFAFLKSFFQLFKVIMPEKMCSKSSNYPGIKLEPALGT